MPNNFDLIPTTELSRKAKGGTELMLQRIYGGDVPRELLEKVQIHPSRPENIGDDKPQILYLHDLPNEPAVQRLSEPWWRDRFAAFVCVSNWQMDRFNLVKNLPYAKSLVIPNAITPFDEKDLMDARQQRTQTTRLIYHTTPHRGLEILVPVFIELAKTHNVHLDVYSSFSIYGWDERDEPYKPLFKLCEDHPNITYHGAVSNDEVRKALTKADIFAYPSIHQETSCLALIEAMSAGLVCVHPNLAALPETSLGLTEMYQWNEDRQRHAAVFHGVLEHAIVREKRANDDYALNFQKVSADFAYDWKRQAPKWTHLLSALTTRGSSPENGESSTE